MNPEGFLDPYLILGIPDFADERQIATAYRRLARRFHPDINPSPRATERMQEINWAYELLRNPSERARFDRMAYAPVSPPPPEPTTATDEEPSPPSRMSMALTRLWMRVFAHDIRFMHRKSVATAAALIIAFTIFLVTSVLSNFGLGLMIALPAAWLVAIFHSAGPVGRSGGLIGALLGLFASTLACGGLTLYATAGEFGDSSYIASGRVIWLFGIPIAAIAASLVGMMGDEE